MELEKKLQRSRGDEDGDDEYCSPLMEDILFEEILPRLPVESLIRFKLVSKKWLHYITDDSHFIYRHLCRQSQTTKLSLIFPRCNNKMYLFDEPSKRAQVRDLSLHMSRYCRDYLRQRVVGSCNGLVCVKLELWDQKLHPLVAVHHDREEVVLLWNPETGQARDVLVPPLPPSFYQGRKVDDYPVYGFGFDKYRDDYKVVRVVPTKPTLLNFDVFSLNIGDWRRLKKVLRGYTVCSESLGSVLINGCSYWLVLAVEENSNAKRRCILSFDLHDEEFRIIDVLEHCPYFHLHSFQHRLIKWKENCLGYLSFPYDQRCGFDFRFRLILDSNGNVVTDGLNAPSARGFAWSSDPPSYSRYVDQFHFESRWKFGGVSQGRLFVEERDTRPDGRTVKLIMYDSFGCVVENICHLALSLVDRIWASRNVCSIHDYVPSLVSVYPNRKVMMEEKKKMEAKYWVDMFWNMVGLNKEQFGLSLLTELG